MILLRTWCLRAHWVIFKTVVLRPTPYEGYKIKLSDFLKTSGGPPSLNFGRFLKINQDILLNGLIDCLLTNILNEYCSDHGYFSSVKMFLRKKPNCLVDQYFLAGIPNQVYSIERNNSVVCVFHPNIQCVKIAQKQKTSCRSMSHVMVCTEETSLGTDQLITWGGGGVNL